jgi:hypothetical protein
MVEYNNMRRVVRRGIEITKEQEDARRKAEIEAEIAKLQAEIVKLQSHLATL